MIYSFNVCCFSIIWPVGKNFSRSQRNLLYVISREAEKTSCTCLISWLYDCYKSNNTYLLLFGSIACFVLLHQWLLWVDIQLVSHWCTTRCGAATTSPLRGSTHTAWGGPWNKNKKGQIRVINTNMSMDQIFIVTFLTDKSLELN